MRVQEIPVWMLDTAACRSTRATAEPVAALSALVALRGLLSEALQRATTGATPEAGVASPDSIVETAMLRQRRQARRLHRQLDLCLAHPPSATDAVPGWSTLPDPTQRALTGLLTRLLIAYADGTAPDLSAQPEGDADER